MNSYLGRFERFATGQRWNRAGWALYLSALLKGRALDVYSMLFADQASNYDQLKAALLKRYQLSADGFKRRFRTAKPKSGKTPTQFLTRIGNYLQRWIDLANAEKIFDGLKTLIIQEQYLNTCQKKMTMHLKKVSLNPFWNSGRRLKTTSRLMPQMLSLVLIQSRSESEICDQKLVSATTVERWDMYGVNVLNRYRLEASEKNSDSFVSSQNLPRQRRQFQQQWVGFERQSWSLRQQGQYQQRLSLRQYGQASQEPRSPRQYRQT